MPFTKRAVDAPGRGDRPTFPYDAAQDAAASSDQLLSAPPPFTTEDLPRSPPYGHKASHLDLVPDPNASPSPSYRSASMLESAPDEKQKNRVSVHYADEIAVPLHDHEENHSRASPPHSAASSVFGTDDEDEGEYDWSDEEDLVDEEAKFEKKMGSPQTKTGWGFKRIVTSLFSTLIGSTFLAAVLVAPGVLLHFYYYKPHPTALRHKVTLNVQAWLFWAAANLLISWYLAVIVDIVPSLVRFLISASWGHVSETIKSRIEMYNSIKNTIKPVLYAASCWVSWVIIFGHIFKLYGDDSRNHQAYTKPVIQIVEFFFFFTLVLCAQRLLSHLIAFAFHRTAFKDRVDAVQETLQVVEQLREYRPKLHHSKRTSALRTPLFGGFGTPTPTLDKDHFNLVSTKLKDHKRDSEKRSWLGRGNGKNSGKKGKERLQIPEVVIPVQSRSSSHHVSTVSEDESPHQYPPSRDHERDVTLVGTAAKVIRDVVLHDARNIRGEDAAGNLEWNVSSASEAKRLARSIYMRLKSPTRNFLIATDFRPAFPTTEAAEAAFRVFDSDNNGDLSRAEIKTTLLKVYKERRFLARAMRDVGAALKTLDQILLVFALGVQFFISLSVFGVNITNSLTSVYTLIVGASFIFKTAASSVFDSIMFLFVTHPFDTGDRCFIDNEIMVVKKMGLFATVFTRWDGTESYYFNSQLANKFITNVRRSGKMFESLTMQVAWRTPLAKLDALDAAINKWLATEENRWFVPSTNITLQHIDFQRYLEFTMAIGHNGTWQDWSLRNARKTAFHAAVQYYCRELGIECYNSPQPVIWADPNRAGGLPPYPAPASPLSATSSNASPGAAGENDAVLDAALVKPPTTLGFTPRATSTLLRARTGGKKAALRAAGGGDM